MHTELSPGQTVLLAFVEGPTTEDTVVSIAKGQATLASGHACPSVREDYTPHRTNPDMTAVIYESRRDQDMVYGPTAKVGDHVVTVEGRLFSSKPVWDTVTDWTPEKATLANGRTYVPCLSTLRGPLRIERVCGFDERRGYRNFRVYKTEALYNLDRNEDLIAEIRAVDQWRIDPERLTAAAKILDFVPQSQQPWLSLPVVHTCPKCGKGLGRVTSMHPECGWNFGADIQDGQKVWILPTMARWPLEDRITEETISLEDLGSPVERGFRHARKDAFIFASWAALESRLAYMNWNNLATDWSWRIKTAEIREPLAVARALGISDRGPCPG